MKLHFHSASNFDLISIASLVSLLDSDQWSLASRGCRFFLFPSSSSHQNHSRGPRFGSSFYFLCLPPSCSPELSCTVPTCWFLEKIIDRLNGHFFRSTNFHGRWPFKYWGYPWTSFPLNRFTLSLEWGSRIIPHHPFPNMREGQFNGGFSFLFLKKRKRNQLKTLKQTMTGPEVDMVDPVAFFQMFLVLLLTDIYHRTQETHAHLGTRIK